MYAAAPIPWELVVPIFGLVAALYASVGHAGATGYLAIMALAPVFGGVCALLKAMLSREQAGVLTDAPPEEKTA